MFPQIICASRSVLASTLVMVWALLLLTACDSPPGPPTASRPSGSDRTLEARYRRAQGKVAAALAASDLDGAQRILEDLQRQIVAAEAAGAARADEIEAGRRFIATTMEQIEALREEVRKTRIRDEIDTYLRQESFGKARSLLRLCLGQGGFSDAMIRFCEDEIGRVETAHLGYLERRVQDDVARGKFQLASGYVGVQLYSGDFSAAGQEHLDEFLHQIEEGERVAGRVPPPRVASRPPAMSPPAPSPPPAISPSRPPVDAPEVFGLSFAYVPSGRYFFGTPPAEPGRDGIDSDPNSLEIEGFFISTTEVTQEAFTTILQWWIWNEYVGPRIPAHSVNFEEAQAFCNALSTPRMQFSLPTEIEWEVAARAGQPPEYGPVVGLPDHQRRFLAGLDEAAQALQNYAVFSANKVGSGPVEVRQKKPNPLGLFDMHGNVAEWSRPEERLPDLYSNVLLEKPLRGGSVQSPYARCRAGARALERADSRTPTIGFRVIARPR